MEEKEKIASRKVKPKAIDNRENKTFLTLSQIEKRVKIFFQCSCCCKFFQGETVVYKYAKKNYCEKCYEKVESKIENHMKKLFLKNLRKEHEFFEDRNCG